MKRFVFSYLVISLIIYASSSAQAQGIPVYDASSFTQMVTQLDAMSKDYQKQMEQLEQAIKQADAITGSRNMGSLNNSPVEADLRRYLPTTWEQTLEMMSASGLGNTGSSTQHLYNSLTTTFKPLPGSEFLPSDPAGPISRALDRRNNTTYAAMAASEQAYNGVSNHIDAYENMLKELDNSPDLKASVDLQARIAAENGMLFSEILRLQAMQIQQSSASDNETLTGYRRATTANKYDPSAAANAFKPKE